MPELDTRTLPSVIALARLQGFTEILRVPLARTDAGESPSITFMFHERFGLLLMLEANTTRGFTAGRLYGNHRPSNTPGDDIVFPIGLQLSPSNLHETLVHLVNELAGWSTFITPWQVRPHLQLAHTFEIRDRFLSNRFDEITRLDRIKQFPTHIRRIIVPCLRDDL